MNLVKIIECDEKIHESEVKNVDTVTEEKDTTNVSF